jgi:ferrous iron transport protein B
VRIVAVAGNPNSGKTSIFNLLTGGNQQVGNWPGVTVEKKEGVVRLDGEAVAAVDLPGVYSLSATAEDEKIARDFLLGGGYDLVLNVVDATNLERNLYLTTLLLEMKIPVLVVLNMMDLVRRNGISLQPAHLAQHLGVPVVALSALERGAERALKLALREALSAPRSSSSRINYPNEVEELIARWQGPVGELAASLRVGARWLAVKLIEADPWVREKVLAAAALAEQDIDREIGRLASLLRDEADVIAADARYGFIHGISSDVITRAPRKARVTERIDEVALHRILGIPLFLAVMYLLFNLTITLGGRLINPVERLFRLLAVDGLGRLMEGAGAPPWLVVLTAGGLGTGIQTVATFVPIVGIMFLLLSILEDSGYMARAAFVMDRFMRLLGLPGKAFVPLIVGFGCTVPAILGTRTLENRKDRLTTIFMAPLMSCGARLPVYALFAAAFFARRPSLAVFCIYLIGILLAVGTGLLLKGTLFRGEASHFVMELPPYHAPRLRHILLHTWVRLRAFLVRAGLVIAVMVTVLGFLNALGRDAQGWGFGKEDSLLSEAGRALAPAFGPLGVRRENWPAAVGLLTGLFAKEAVIGTLTSLYGQNAAGGPPGTEGDRASLFTRLRENFSPAGAFAYLLFVLIYFPCVAATATAFREIGAPLGFLLVGYLTALAWIVATLFYQIAEGKSAPWIAVAAGLAGLIVLLLWLAGRRRAGSAGVRLTGAH